MKAYWRFAGEWTIGEDTYRGKAVISQEAIYLCAFRTTGGSSWDIVNWLLALVGGVFWIVIAIFLHIAAKTELQTIKRLESERVLQGRLSQLPDEVLTHPDWPLRKVKEPDMKNVVMIPITEVAEWRFPWWSDIRLGLRKGECIRLNPRASAHWKLRKYFRTFHYPES